MIRMQCPVKFLLYYHLHGILYTAEKGLLFRQV